MAWWTKAGAKARSEGAKKQHALCSGRLVSLKFIEIIDYDVMSVVSNGTLVEDRKLRSVVMFMVG